MTTTPSALMGPEPQPTPALRALELRMWCASLLAWAAYQSGDIQAATADEVAGTVALTWEGHRFLIRLAVTPLKEGPNGRA